MPKRISTVSNVPATYRQAPLLSLGTSYRVELKSVGHDGVQDGSGKSAATVITNASVRPASNASFFTMGHLLCGLKFELEAQTQDRAKRLPKVKH